MWDTKPKVTHRLNERTTDTDGSLVVTGAGGEGVENTVTGGLALGALSARYPDAELQNCTLEAHVIV